MANVRKMKITLVWAIFTTVMYHVLGADPGCKDLLDDCELYGKYVCDDYKPWAQVRCSAYCGFCQAPATSPRPCLDVLSNCFEYQEDMCTNKVYYFWARDHCYKFCKFCTEGTDSATTTVKATLRTPPSLKVILTPPMRTPPIRTPPKLSAVGKRA